MMSNHPERTPRARQLDSAEGFERGLFAALTFVLTISTTLMPKTYIPDRWMIGGWTTLAVALVVTLAAHFLGQAGLHRTRLGAHAVAACLLALGLALTIVFVSEGDDGGDDETNYAGDHFVEPRLTAGLPSTPALSRGRARGPRG